MSNYLKRKFPNQSLQEHQEFRSEYQKLSHLILLLIIDQKLETKKRLLNDGKIVILFSNLAQITDVAKENPIKKEVAEGGRFKLDLYLKKSVKSASEKTKETNTGVLQRK